MNFLKIFDFYPLSFQFNIKGNQHMKTTTGGTFSVLTTLLIFALIIFNLYNYFSYRTPLVLSINRFYADNPAEPFDLSNINFASMFYLNKNFMQIGIQQINSSCTYFNIDYSKSFEAENDIGSLIPCNQANTTFSKNFAYLVTNKMKEDVKFTTCFNKNDSIKNIELGGNNALTLQIRKLVFSSSYDICSVANADICNSIDYLEQTKIIFSMYYKNIFLNMNLREGYSEFLDHDSSSLLASNDLMIEMKIKKNIIYSDDNYLYSFHPVNKYEIFTVSSVNFTPMKRDSSYPNRLTILYLIEMDKYIQIHRREYSKLDQILSNTLSIFSLFLFVFRNLTKFIEMGSIEHYIMKKIYFFEPHKPDSHIIKIKRNKSFINKVFEENESNNRQYEKCSYDSKINKSNLRFSEQAIIDRLRDRLRNEHPPNIKFLRIFYLFCCNNDRNKKQQLMKIIKGEEMLLYDMNIVNILKKILEIELIKDLILDKNHISLFTTLYNRKITSNLNVKQIIKDVEKKQLNFKIINYDLKRIWKSFSFCTNSTNKIDKKIASLSKL